MLAQLPNGLLLQIAGHLSETQRIDKKHGFSIRNDITPQDRDFYAAVVECNKYYKSLKPLVSLALTCKRLTPVAQEILFRDVSLPQTHPAWRGRISPVVSFLRTLVQRPDLARYVERLAVSFLKDNPIDLPKQTTSTCTCGKCSSSLRAIVERMHQFPSSAATGWMCDLKDPKEALAMCPHHCKPTKTQDARALRCKQPHPQD
jgi:bacterioferritin-associated ferredoxin